MSWVRAPRVEEVAPVSAEAAAGARRQVEGPPIAVTIALAVGLLVSGSLLCAGFLATMNQVVRLDRDDVSVVAGIAGLVALGASSAASWVPLPWLLRPLVLVGAVVGRGLVAAAVGDALPEDAARAVLVGVELALLVGHRDPLQRWGAAALAVGWVVFDRETWAPFVAVPVLALGVGLAATRRVWAGGPAREVLAPLAGGLLAASLALPAIPGPAWPAAITVGVGLVAAVLAGVVATGIGLALADVALVVAFPLLVGGVTFGVPGVTVAILVACTGFLARAPTVWASAVAALVGYAVWFYYDLDLPLFQKGGLMIALGALCGLAGWRAGTRRAAAVEPVATARPGRAWAAVGGLVAATLVWGLAGWQEVRLQGAEVVYLPLAPRDPRSLVQGDYQRLGYALSLDLAAAPTDAGVVVLAVDAAHVASFARLDDGAPLGPGEVRVRYAADGRARTVASRAWLFEEGRGGLYDRARYGIVAVPRDGNAVLVGLADQERHRLGPPRRLW